MVDPAPSPRVSSRLPAVGWIRLVAGRMRDDLILIVAAWVTIVIATTAMAASVISSDEVARSAIQHVLTASSPTDTALMVAAAETVDLADETDAIVRSEIGRALGPAAGTVWGSGRSDAYTVEALTETPKLIVFGFADDLDRHAHLVEGAWPPPAPDADGTIVVAVSAGAAKQLGVSVGSGLTAVSRIDGRQVPVRVGGIYAIDDPDDPFWWHDPLELDGIEEASGFTTVGPLMADHDILLSHLTAIWADLRWRAVPERAALDPTTVGAVAGGVGGLRARINTDLGRKGAATVTTDLPDILARAALGTRSSGSSVLLLDAQVIVLAGYALILVAAMVVERRRGGTAVLRVRGATTLQLLRLAVLEAVLLVIPAALLGPVLALGLLELLGRLGPAATVAIGPRLTADALTLATIAALVAVVGMTLPVLAPSGPIAAVRRSVSRQLSRTVFHRTGIDLALVAFAGIVLWELRANGTPISASFRGTIGIDPLLVAAPAIGLAAGAILTMRVVPVLASWLERPIASGQGVMVALAARSISRRPSRYSRSALLLVVAVAIAFLAGTYSRTWQQSQLDQVSLELPTDVRARPREPTGSDLGSVPAAAARGAYLTVPGVTGAAPVINQEFDLERSGGKGRLIAIVPELAASTMTFRPDLADRPFSDLMAAMSEGRPALSVVPLSGEPARLRLTIESDVRTSAAGPSSIAPSTGPLAFSMAVVARDAVGLLHRYPAGGSMGGGTTLAEVPLAILLPDGSSVRPQYPLELVAVEFVGQIPAGTIAAGSVRLTRIEAAAAPDGGWSTVDAPSAFEAWTYARVLVERGLGSRVTVDGAPGVVGLDPSTPPNGLHRLTLTLGPAELAALPTAALPGLADARLVGLAAPGADGEVSLRQGYAEVRTLALRGRVHLFPTQDPARPAAIVDLPTLELAEYARSGLILPADEWWISTAEAASSVSGARGVVDALSNAAFPLGEIRSRPDEVAARTADPFQAGVTGVLGIVAGAALLFALVGLAISTWFTVSSRQGEFAVARALGLTPRQLLGWLAFESAFLLVVGLVGGLLVGLVLAWVVMPSITLTAGGATALPEPVAVMAWDLAAALAALGVGAFALSVAAARRAVDNLQIAATLRVAEPDR